MNPIKEVDIAGQCLLLLPQRAVFWQQAQMLIVADPHFGKSQVFRRRGIPIPSGVTADDLARLSFLMERLRPVELLILGDLMHGPIEDDRTFVAAIGHWRRHWPNVRLTLVTGNHDSRAGRPPAAFRCDRIVDRLAAPPFIFIHKPGTNLPVSGYIIAGHTHPAVCTRGKARQRETLPCFCFGEKTALLPAFGGFTGSHVIHPARRDRVYVIAGDEVIGMLPE